VFTFQAPGKQWNYPRDPLLGFGSSAEVAQAPSRCIESRVSLRLDAPCSRTSFCSASLEVWSPSASSRTEQRLKMVGPSMPNPPAPSGFLNLLAPSSAPSLPALFHAGSALGVTLQSFLPPAQPYAVSSAVPLVAFQPPSGCRSTRESAIPSGGLDRNGARGSPGFFPSRVHAFSAMARISPVLPSCGCLFGRKRPKKSTPGCCPQRTWPISLEIADPLGVLGLLIRHIRLSIDGFWSRLLRSPGCVTIPSSALL